MWIRGIMISYCILPLIITVYYTELIWLYIVLLIMYEILDYLLDPK